MIAALLRKWLLGPLGWLLAGLTALVGVWVAGRRSEATRAKLDDLEGHKKTTERMQDADVPLSDDPAVLRDWLRERGKR